MKNVTPIVQGRDEGRVFSINVGSEDLRTITDLAKGG